MPVTNLLGGEISTAVNSAVLEHGTDSEELIPILLAVNEHLGYLPTQAMAEISKLMSIPISRVYSVASFYELLSTEPRGRHVLQFCESAPCHVMGGRQLFHAILEELELQPGETSSDGKWTFITTSCLGTCGVGPVLIIDDELIGNVTPGMLPALLARYE
jgi:NADH:ubiquinone oxidoreductase subunit E